MTPALPGPVLLPTVMQMCTNCDIANRYSKGMRSTNVQSQLVIKILTKMESAATQLVSNAQHTHVISYSLSSFIAFDAPRDSDIFMADCDMVSESSDILIDFCAFICALNLFSPPLKFTHLSPTSNWTSLSCQLLLNSSNNPDIFIYAVYTTPTRPTKFFS